jgi:hypothetical protein
MKFYFVPPPAPLIPAKPLDNAVSHAPGALRCAEIGPKTGPMIRRRSALATACETRKSAPLQGFSEWS